MLDKKYIKVLIEVVSKLDENNIRYFLIGSVNQALQGLKITPNDIDILVKSEDLDKIKNIFKNYNIKREHKLKNGEGKETLYIMNGIEVQFCGEYKHGIYRKDSENNVFEMLINNQKIKIFNLEKEAEIYNVFGRREKADRILKHLQL